MVASCQKRVKKTRHVQQWFHTTILPDRETHKETTKTVLQTVIWLFIIHALCPHLLRVEQVAMLELPEASNIISIKAHVPGANLVGPDAVSEVA